MIIYCQHLPSLLNRFKSKISLNNSVTGVDRAVTFRKGEKHSFVRL